MMHLTALFSLSWVGCRWVQLVPVGNQIFVSKMIQERHFHFGSSVLVYLSTIIYTVLRLDLQK